MGVGAPERKGLVIVRRALWILGAVAVLLAGVGVAPAQAADPAYFRQSGADRYGTAAAVSSKAFPNGADNVFLASGTTFPDALAGASLAAALGGPILLAQKSTLPAATRGELERLHPKSITLLGGPGSISDEVGQAALAYASVEVRRIAGADRYETAVAISTGFTPPVSTVYIASGTNFPDALTGGAAIGGTTGGPLLLVGRDGIPSSTAAELTRLQPSNIFVLGGPASVSDAVLEALRPYSPNPPIRRSGPDRYSTSIAVAIAFPSAPVVYLARGDEFADAVAAGASAAFRKGPILLVPKDCIPFDAALTIRRLHPEQVIVLGGTNSLSQAIVDGTECSR